MYEIGEKLLYGIHGICTVTAIERMRFGKEKADYYVLEPKAVVSFILRELENTH